MNDFANMRRKIVLLLLVAPLVSCARSTRGPDPAPEVRITAGDRIAADERDKVPAQLQLADAAPPPADAGMPPGVTDAAPLVPEPVPPPVDADLGLPALDGGLVMDARPPAVPMK